MDRPHVATRLSGYTTSRRAPSISAEELELRACLHRMIIDRAAGVGGGLERGGEVEDMDAIADLSAGETTFTTADLSAERIRAAVSDARSLGRPGDIELVSYVVRWKHPLSVAVWIRHDPVSSVLQFDPQGGSTAYSSIRSRPTSTRHHSAAAGVDGGL